MESKDDVVIEKRAKAPCNSNTRNNCEVPGDGKITRQQSRASVREAAYTDANETFGNAPRRVRRAMARKAVTLVVRQQKGKPA